MSRTATATDLIPEPHCVLGTLLRPFSLGHHLLLTKLGSPFASEPAADATPDQLGIAVFICAAPYTESLAALLRGEWETEFKRWQKQIRPGLFAPRWQHHLELERFRDYLSDGYRRAPVWRHDAATGIRFSAPWECLLKSRLVAGGYSEAEVLEKYLPAAWYDYHTLAEISQAQLCPDAARWRKIFYTAEDHARLHPEENN